MYARNALGALLLILGLTVLAPAKPVRPISARDPENKPIADLIEQLGSTKARERSAAAEALEAIGAPALPLLKKARAASDSDASKIAGNLIRRIEENLLTASVLIPKKVHFKMAGVPVGVAVNELSRLSGYAIKMRGDLDKLEGKEITLDTGDVSFWEAFDKLCDLAGLMEPLSMPMPSGPPKKKPGEGVAKGGFPSKQVPPPNQDVAVPPPVQPQLAQKAPAPVQIPIKFQGQPSPLIKLDSKAPAEIIVVAGSSRNRHVCYAGSVRARLYAHASAKAGQYQIILEASAEPRLQNFAMVSFPTLEQVIDEHGQNLAAGAELMRPYNPSPHSIALGPLASTLRAIELRVLRQQIVMRFKEGPKHAKLLKVFAGNLTVGVNAPPEALLTVKDVLKGSGESAKRPNGNIVKLDKIEMMDNGDYRVKISFKPAPGSGTEGINVGMMQIEKLVDRAHNEIGHIVPPGLPELFDGAGNIYKAVKIPFRQMSQFDGTGTQEITIQYRADDGQGIPDRLVVSSSRPVIVSIPIVFHDVPLE